MISFNFEKECYSCTACKTVCPTGAISFDRDLMPHLDEKICLRCGKCDQVCIHEREVPFTAELSPIANGYVCASKNRDIKMKSSSGGVFFSLAERFIKAGDYVCGCVYDSEFMPKHIVSDNIEDVVNMMGSKYVQSDLSDVFSEIKNILGLQKKVLFTGVPCQIAAAKNIFGDNESIFYIAVVCHGSISRSVWKKYLLYEQNIGKIKSVTMRDKAKGWLNYGLKFVFEDGRIDVTYRKQDGYFLKSFTDGLFERERCLSCNYKGDRIFADILLGDGWGMTEMYPTFEDELGLSSVICLTEKGLKLFDTIKEFVKVEAVDVKMITSTNPRIISSPKRNRDRDRFLKVYMSKDNPYAVCKKYSANTLINRIKNKLCK